MCGLFILCKFFWDLMEINLYIVYATHVTMANLVQVLDVHVSLDVGRLIPFVPFYRGGLSPAVDLMMLMISMLWVQLTICFFNLLYLSSYYRCKSSVVWWLHYIAVCYFYMVNNHDSFSPAVSHDERSHGRMPVCITTSILEYLWKSISKIQFCIMVSLELVTRL